MPGHCGLRRGSRASDAILDRSRIGYAFKVIPPAGRRPCASSSPFGQRMPGGRIAAPKSRPRIRLPSVRVLESVNSRQRAGSGLELWHWLADAVNFGGGVMLCANELSRAYPN